MTQPAEDQEQPGPGVLTPSALIDFLRLLAGGTALHDLADGMEDGIQRTLSTDKKSKITLELTVEKIATRDGGAPPLNWSYAVKTTLPPYPTDQTILYRDPSGKLVRYRPDQDALPGFIDEPQIVHDTKE